MAGRRTNLALLALTAVATGTGVAMFAVGSGWNAWPTVAHGAAGVAMVALAPWKSLVARRGVRRRGVAESAPSIGLSAAVAVALATGFAHRTGVRELGPLLVQQVHVGAALVAVPLAAWHVVARPVRPLRPRAADVDRRAVLLAGGSALVTVALPTAGDRATRSLERGSFDPDAMPVTSWLDDTAPDPAPGRRVVVAGRPWSEGDLAALAGDEVVATLDCTGGWYATQRWTGVRLDRLLAASGAPAGRTIEVRSSTGYARRFPAADGPRLLLATAAGGAPLSAGHGFPARLVAPGRRGYWWVKWVDEVRVDDRPWWWQPPFPLT